MLSNGMATLVEERKAFLEVDEPLLLAGFLDHGINRFRKITEDASKGSKH
jgi:hypothetical protein